MINLYKKIETALLSSTVENKMAELAELKQWILLEDFGEDEVWDKEYPILEIQQAGIPSTLNLVSPRDVKTRNYNNEEGYAALLHSICHIEFNAINLALDAAYRYRNIDKSFTLDWLQVAIEEAKHFFLMNERLESFGYRYGDFDAHNNLWEMAYKTAYDPLVRMALVPRVLEARGLDVTPQMQKKIQQKQDNKTNSVLDIIYQEEIGHVKIGNYWYQYLAKQRQLDPIILFQQLINRYDMFIFRGYFNITARQQAGFSELELKLLESFENDIRIGNHNKKNWRFALSN